MFSHIMAMKLILLFVIKYSMMGNGLNRMLWSLLRYAKVESGILFHVYEVQRYFLVSSCFKLSTILKQAIFFTHIFRSKYFVSPLECFQCLLMFSKLNGGNGLQVIVRGVDKDFVCLLAATTSRLENQVAIDATIVGIMADPKEVRGRPFSIQQQLKKGNWVTFSYLCSEMYH